MDQDNVKLGLLIEAAQTHQKLAEAAIEKLNKQTQGLEAVVRHQVQRALLDGLQSLHVETKSAVQVLQRAKCAAYARAGLWTLAVTAAAAAIALFVAWWVLPTPAEIAALRTERDELASEIAFLKEHGAQVDLRGCGAGRLCVTGWPSWKKK